jgi:predicted transcriptional regulator
MSTHAPSTSASPPSIDPQLWARLQRLAAAAGCGAGDLVVDVLREFADEEERHLAAIDAAMAEADAGEIVDYDDVKVDVARKLAELSARR